MGSLLTIYSKGIGSVSYRTYSGDSLRVLFIDTLSMKGYVTHYLCKSYKLIAPDTKSYAVTKFIFKDSTSIVKDRDNIKMEDGYYYFSRHDFMRFLINYMDYERFKKGNDSAIHMFKIESTPKEPLYSEIKIKEADRRKSICKMKVYRTNIEEYMLIKIPYSFITKIEEGKYVPISIVPKDGWINVLVPL